MWTAPKMREEDIKMSIPIIDPISKSFIGYINEKRKNMATIYLTYRVDFSYNENEISEEDAVNLLGENFMEPNNDNIQIDNKEFSYSSLL